jgi:hypothetical protein
MQCEVREHRGLVCDHCSIVSNTFAVRLIAAGAVIKVFTNCEIAWSSGVPSLLIILSPLQLND